MESNFDSKKVSCLILLLLNMLVLFLVVKCDTTFPYTTRLSLESAQNALLDTGFATYPIGYALMGSTTRFSGDLSNLVSDDGIGMTFRSYYSGNITVDFVDNMSDVDLSADKGTHSNFSAVQTGPNAIYDVITEENTGTGGSDNYELDLEIQWTNLDYQQVNEELAVYINKQNNTHSLNATGGYMIVGDGTPNWGSTAGTISFWIKWDTVANRPWGQNDNVETRFFGSNLVLDWGTASALASTTSFTAGKWYFIAIVWNENTNELLLYVGDQDTPPVLDAYDNAWTYTVSDEGVTQNNFMASRGGLNPTDGCGDDLRYWNIDRSQTEIQGDFNIELTGFETNLRSYFKLNNDFDDLGSSNDDGNGFGSYSFSSDAPSGNPPTENLQVDVWHGGSWQNLFPDLTDGWNNNSVSAYLDSSTFTIHFHGSVETTDVTQDSWKIDLAFLHVWSDECTAEVEFTGFCSLEEFSLINWTVNNAWTSDQVNVTLQVYNYSLGDYPSSGNGYLGFTSSPIPEVEEKQTQIITVNPEHFLNSTGHWSMRIRGVKTTATRFDLRVDWVELRFYLSLLPTASFNFEPASPTADELVIFDASSSYDENGTIVSYRWDFGDGNVTSVSVSAITHVYASNGTFAVSLTVIDTDGFTDSEIAYVHVLPKNTMGGQSFDWMKILPYTIPIPFGLLGLLILSRRRKNKTKSSYEKETYPFSKSYGIEHTQIACKKILLEIDPAADYQKALSDFIIEAKNSGEKMLVFTSANSPLHLKFSGTENVKFFLLTSQASIPQKVNDKETLLPANDVSILLNTLVKMQRGKTKQSMSMLFDNLSDIILLCGFKKTYKFLRWLFEGDFSAKVTALFVFNPTAHDSKITSFIRSLFQMQLVYVKSGRKIGAL